MPDTMTKLVLCHECAKKCNQIDQSIIVYAIVPGRLGQTLRLAGCIHTKNMTKVAHEEVKVKGYVLIEASNGFDPEYLADTGGRGERLDHRGYRFYVNLKEAEEQREVANAQDCNVTVHEAELTIK